jgi:hypothetical protein
MQGLILSPAISSRQTSPTPKTATRQGLLQALGPSPAQLRARPILSVSSRSRPGQGFILGARKITKSKQFRRFDHPSLELAMPIAPKSPRQNNGIVVIAFLEMGINAAQHGFTHLPDGNGNRLVGLGFN